MQIVSSLMGCMLHIVRLEADCDVMVRISVVNKDLSFKAKAKAKDLTSEHV